jgi:formamidopyrimidine-DNA glycosylase
VPELPETETIARDLDGEVAGLVVRQTRITRPDVLREVTGRAFTKRTTGAGIVRVWRRAKLVVLDLTSGDRLVVQPRFTGALLLDDGSLAERERAYSTLSFSLSDRRLLHYRDIRRLGTVTLMSPARFAKQDQALGPEPLDPRFTADALRALLWRSRQPVKAALMDQRRIAGIGNIYAQEACWRAGIDPSRAANALDDRAIVVLHAAVTGVLRESIAARGTSFRDYRDARGMRGTFADHLAVYGRGGLPCPRCGTRLGATHAIDGRSTVFCFRCQS